MVMCLLVQVSAVSVLQVTRGVLFFLCFLLMIYLPMKQDVSSWVLASVSNCSAPGESS